MGSLALDVNMWTDGGRAVLEVSGEVDAYSAPRLRWALSELSADVPLRLAVVMTEVEFIDSSGIGVLVGVAKRAAAARGRVALVGCSGHIGSMLTMMGLHRVFGLYASLEDAFAWLDAA